jgi:predicted nucleic acid-binding protein
MTPAFADTGYWIALTSPSDDLHPVAIAVTQGLGSRPVMTSEMVLTEFLNDRGGLGTYRRTAAAQFVEDLRTQGRVGIAPQTPALFTEAFALYRKRPDKAWSLTDCASIVICEREGITEVLAYDRHFEQAGLVALLRREP